MSKAESICQKIIDLLIEDGYRFQVTGKDVQKAIMKLRGIDERTSARWIKALTYFDYLKPLPSDIYELNPLMIPKLATLLKDQKQTKLI